MTATVASPLRPHYPTPTATEDHQSHTEIPQPQKTNRPETKQDTKGLRYNPQDVLATEEDCQQFHPSDLISAQDMLNNLTLPNDVKLAAIQSARNILEAMDNLKDSRACRLLHYFDNDGLCLTGKKNIADMVVKAHKGNEQGREKRVCAVEAYFWYNVLHLLSENGGKTSTPPTPRLRPSEPPRAVSEEHQAKLDFAQRLAERDRIRDQFTGTLSRNMLSQKIARPDGPANILKLAGVDIVNFKVSASSTEAAHIIPHFLGSCTASVSERVRKRNWDALYTLFPSLRDWFGPEQIDSLCNGITLRIEHHAEFGSLRLALRHMYDDIYEPVFL
ncbi:hypothetical protein BJ508DRAFT_313163 [Ascobolus immersus RN42]|uniref:HNH nuclease domain-containing protein n=1 Tax=Ascobolus immersus RN42 TaxID=1160509 RepID=A0A3N4HNS1_ASCIM|nr:hypothetical protein BJ508DRAFT_313163 [Ascobolus immersus RN42]